MYTTECEERKLFDWAVEIGKTGYGRTREQASREQGNRLLGGQGNKQTREQASRIVKKLVDKDE